LALAGLDLSPRMAQRVEVPLEPPMRRVVCGGGDAIVLLLRSVLEWLATMSGVAGGLLLSWSFLLRAAWSCGDSLAKKAAKRKK